MIARTLAGLDTTVLSLFVLFICHFWHIPAVQADELEEFEQAREAYERARYEQAIEAFETLVGGEEPRLRSQPLVLESRKYLAASYLFVGKRDEAKEQFRGLLREDPSYELDPVAFPREVHELFAKVREQLREDRDEDDERRRRRIQRELERQQQLERQRARLEELEKVARTETLVEEHSRWIAALPFGVGQFQNGHRRLGLALAISQSAMVATSITTFFLHRSVVQTDQGILDGVSRDDRRTLLRRERAYRYTNWIATGLLAALVAYGIVDAQLRFVPRVETTRRRELPPELEVGVGPGSLRLRLRF